MKRIIALLLMLAMLAGMTTATAEEARPAFETFGSDLWSYSVLGYSDHDYLFYHSLTAGSNLAERYVYCDDDTAVFVTHNGDAVIRFTYEERDGAFYITRVDLFAVVPDSEGGNLLDAITMLAAKLGLCKISLFENTADEFRATFTQNQSFTMNGVRVEGSVMSTGDRTTLSVSFAGVNVRVDSTANAQPASETAAAAAAPVADSITFRGMPWGVSAVEFEDTMKAAGVTASAKAGTIYSWERVNIAEGSIRYAYMPEDRGFVYNVKPKDFMVAGLPVSEISAYFLYGYDDETVYTTKDASHLYHAVYSFDGVADVNATADLLYGKMCSVYGETPRRLATVDHGSFTGYHDYAIWEDANGNAVMLNNSYYLRDDGTPYTSYVWHLDLCYGKSNSVEMMNDLDAAVAREESEAAASNGGVDGL